MSRLLRDEPDVLEVYITRIAAATGIPAAHIEKDFWVTEVLRGVATASQQTGCSIVFKGGTSLSKAHRLIQRFSEDVDLIAILPAGGKNARDKTLKAFVDAASIATGIVPTVDPNSSTTGVKRTATFTYETARDTGILRHAETAGLPIDFDEAVPVSLLVLEPVRTLADKLVLLHHAATEGDDNRKTATARHYYDVDRLLRNDQVIAHLTDSPMDVLAREVCEHSRSAGLPTADRPKGGFATSPAWDPTQATIAMRAYTSTVLPNLVWPNSPTSTFEECCFAVERLARIL
jgi:Nucleotidyl transferase AbiEii toxin, Type IV TA system